MVFLFIHKKYSHNSIIFLIFFFLPFLGSSKEIHGNNSFLEIVDVNSLLLQFKKERWLKKWKIKNHLLIIILPKSVISYDTSSFINWICCASSILPELSTFVCFLTHKYPNLISFHPWLSWHCFKIVQLNKYQAIWRLIGVQLFPNTRVHGSVNLMS